MKPQFAIVVACVCAFAFMPMASLYAGPPESATKRGLPGPSLETIAAPEQRGAIRLSTGDAGPDREIWHLDSGQVAVRNVTHPTLLPFRPVGRRSGAAIIVAPGGGFLGVVIEKEGWDVAKWLSSHGITAFVLKYRVLPTPRLQPEFAEKLKRAIAGENVGFAPPNDTPDTALQDGIAALRYVRRHAADYGIDPKRVGFMGFSAGGFLTRSVIEKGGADAPNFAAPIYPAMGPMRVPSDAPPMFVAIGTNDFLLKPEKGFPLIESYRAAGRPIEFMLLSGADHGFGTGIAGTTTQGWMDVYLQWLRAGGWLKRSN